ncbi:ATP-dependent helicase [Labilibaculum sp.]|uniref:ATP-dependent helicase n=1 Tax=Labilibaculum sp. TaxID=2060723 RepID=UPI00356669ED
MSLKNLHRKLGLDQSTSNEFDPIAAFESEGLPKNENLIPPERFTEPNKDFQQELSSLAEKNTTLAAAFKPLNPYQLQAIFNNKQKTVLSAMVGSGKTTVLTNKLLYLHFIKNIPLSQMAVLTFTNKAAREIKERIFSFYANKNIPNNQELRYFGTFHSIARQLLKEHPKLQDLGFTSSFSIMDQEGKDDFLQRLIISHNLDIKYKNKLDKRLKLYRHEKQLLYGNMKNPDDLPKLLQLSRQEKQANNLMDFDDLISIANWLLQRNKSFLPQWIIVDEFQDCNKDQLDFINHISSENTNFFAVGDPNQSIYSWRGSTSKILQNYVADSSVCMMRLPLNYRTSSQLLSAASCLLQEGSNDLQATRPEGKKLIIRNHFDDNQEAYYLAQKCKELHTNGSAWEEIAVLFRTRQQIDLFESVFSKEGIPCEIVRRISLREQPVLFWLQKVLLASFHPNDLDSITQVFSSPDFGCVKAGKRLINNYQKFSSENPFDTKLEAFTAFLQHKFSKYQQHIALAKALLILPSYLESKKEEQDIYNFLSLDSFLKPTSVNYQEYVSQVKDALEELNRYTQKNYFGNWLEIYQAAMSQVSLEGHFNINSGLQKSTSGIRLLTIHAAKGLEFDYVFLSGANSGIIPLDRKKESHDHLKEEKRLLFVALTRARNHMEISWHTQSAAWNAQQGPSYFLNSIPSTLVHRIENEKESKQINDVNTNKSEIESEGKWPKGTKVKHPKYGVGVIHSCTINDTICEFGKFGKKSFATAWAPLEKI